MEAEHPGRERWAGVAGLLAAAGGVAVSELLSGFAHLRVSPVEAVAEMVIQYTPGTVAAWAIDHLGHADKPLVVAGTLVVLALVAVGSGVLAARSLTAAELVFVAMGVVGLLAVHDRLPAGATRYFPVIVGILVAMVLLGFLVPRAVEAADASARRRSESPPTLADARTRRSFLALAAAVAVLSAGVAAAGRVLAHSRAEIEAARARLAGRFHRRPTPAGVSVAVPGMTPWVTPVPDFYRVDTALAVPLVDPDSWQLRIHGLVERELTLTYDDLLARGLAEHWMTLCCVSNPVGGPYIGNGMWTGVLIAPILDEVRPRAGADAVRSESVDGWTAGTPLAALRDGRKAMFAMALDGRPLTPEHGFPVRMVVPGLYGYVSGTKWITDFEVTRFDDFQAFWVERGWSRLGPVKTQSRIDVPRDGASLKAGRVMVAGVAWAQHRGIERVEVRIDSGPWHVCRLAADPTIDSWRQWVYAWDATQGSHVIEVRATDDEGVTQTAVRQGTVPNGATGYDQISVSVA